MASSPRLMSLLILVLSSHVTLTNALRLWGLRAVGLPGDALGNRPDPYVTVWCDGLIGGKTEVITGTHNPTWNKGFSLSCKTGATLKMEVWDKDIKYDDYLGVCTHRVSTTSGTGKELTCTSLKKGTFYYRYNV
ncbi:hypothetical protein PHYPO_G00138360 [Pangasianodon hypophthalmus]|uniref:C2 domain-containing protein n=1 Tax=Pangasianodon hypophthalmus TaxID=310915 RepID=A0A5N5K9S6_PANHP|nr:hypothetical protein PHYPO_G00138360 [Pangasianodon hypophthalmus]